VARTLTEIGCRRNDEGSPEFAVFEPESALQAAKFLFVLAKDWMTQGIFAVLY
jgi:hypothetical protein